MKGETMTLQEAAKAVLKLAELGVNCEEEERWEGPSTLDIGIDAIKVVETHFASLRKVEEEMDALLVGGIKKFAAELDERNAHLLQQRKNEHYFEKYSEED